MYLRNWAIALLFTLMVFAGGCSSSNSSNNGGGGGVTGGGGVNAPAAITVAGGQTTSGVDIAVVSPASTPTPNAESIGLGTSASNAGTTISQGSTQTVILFGPGLSGNMQVSLSGPADITVSNPQSIMSTDNMPGISFTAQVASDAALGARTVVLQDTNNDITTFTGGLEVVP